MRLSIPMDYTEKIFTLVPAAGGGTRMGRRQNKLLIPIDGVPVIIRTLQAFLRHPSIEGVLLVTSASDQKALRDLCVSYKIASRVEFAEGGATRQDSVWNGLRSLASVAGPQDIVLIQDGARCFTDSPTIDRCLQETRRSGACCAAVRTKDTLKESDADGRVIATPDRSRYWMIQTPQAFRYGLIADAYLEAHRKGIAGTDDASLVEAAGYPVQLVEGSYLNIKITTPDDLLFGEAIARAHFTGQ